MPLYHAHVTYVGTKCVELEAEDEEAAEVLAADMAYELEPDEWGDWEVDEIFEVSDDEE